MEKGQGDRALMLEHSYGGPSRDSASNTQEAALEDQSNTETTANQTASPAAPKTNSTISVVTVQSPNKGKSQPRVVILRKSPGQATVMQVPASVKPEATAPVAIAPVATAPVATAIVAKVEEDKVSEKHTDDRIQKDTEQEALPVAEDPGEVPESDSDTQLPFVCGICQEKFAELASFCTHVKSHDKTEKYFHSCQDQKKKVLEALNIVENTETRMFRCGICSMDFPSMCKLHEHMLNDEKIKDYKYSNEEKTAYAKDDNDEDDSMCTLRSTRKRKDKDEEDQAELRSLRKRKRTNEGNDDDTDKGGSDESKGEVTMETPVKRGRGRPRKSEVAEKVDKKVEEKDEQDNEEKKGAETKRGRGRPRKSEVKEEKPAAENVSEEADSGEQVKTPRGRGRPRKSDVIQQMEVSKGKTSTPKPKTKTPAVTPRNTSKGEKSADIIMTSPRANTSYGLRGQRKMSKRYSDYVVDTSWIKKEVIEVEEEESDKKEEEDEDMEENETVEEVDSDESNFEEDLKKELEEKERKRKAKLDKDQKILMALDGTQYLVDDEPEMMDTTDQNAEIDEQDEKHEKKTFKKVTPRPRKFTKHDLEVVRTKLEQRVCEKCDEPYFLPPGIKDESEFVHKCLVETEDPGVEAPVVAKDEILEETNSFLKENFRQNTQTCQVCHKKFMNYRRLRRHVLTHMSTKKYRCNLCGKQFKLRAYLNDHKRFYHKLTAPERKALESVQYVGPPRRPDPERKGNPTSGDYDPSIRRPCPICGKYFENKRMRRHMVCHLSARSVRCDMCPKRFKCTAHMRDHKKLVHQRTILRCKVCRRVFRHYKSLECHLAQHVRKSEIENMAEYKEKYIEVVKAVSDSSSQTEKKYLKDEGEEDDELDGIDVDEMVNQLMSMGDTMYEKGSKIFIDDESIDFQYDCEFCGKRFETADGLSSHVDETHTDPATHACYICEKSFKDAAVLKRHMLIHVAMRKFFCDKCGSGFKSSQQLQEHCRVAHVYGREYSCNICSDTYKSEQSLWTHKNLHLKVTNKYYSKEVEEMLKQEEKEREMNRLETTRTPKYIVCEDCGKEILAKRYFRHKDTHKKVKDIQCDICPKKFTSYRYMKDHKSRTHFTGKTATCDACGLMFKANYIEKHRLIHGPKDKMCPICGKGFTTDFYLKIHLGTHEAKKRMKCPECDSGFSHKSRLDIHLIEKHGHGQPRPCKYCELMFPSRQKARMHERKVHEGYKLPYRDKTKYRYKSLVSQSLVSSALPEGYHIEVREADEEVAEGEQMYVEQVGADGDSVEHILELPENAEQCQILLFPNGTFKVLNVDGSGEDAVQMITTEEGETIWQETTEAEVVEAAMAVKDEETKVEQVEIEEGAGSEQEVVAAVGGEIVEGVELPEGAELAEGEVMTMSDGQMVTLQNGEIVRVALVEGDVEDVEGTIVTGTVETEGAEVQQQVAIIANQ